MGQEQRKSPRNKTYAKVLLEGCGIPGYLRDLSKEGCQLALIRKPPVQKSDALNVEVLPSEEMRIPRFSMTVQIIWTRIDPVYFLVGGLITAVKGKAGKVRLDQLFRYYA
jgi:hypothetical protein